MKWYSLRVISGKEKAAKENIMFDAEEHNLDEFISEIFVPFEDKTPFLDRLGQGINESLDRIVQMSTLATATITTIYLVRNINN